MGLRVFRDDSKDVEKNKTNIGQIVKGFTFKSWSSKPSSWDSPCPVVHCQMSPIHLCAWLVARFSRRACCARDAQAFTRLTCMARLPMAARHFEEVSVCTSNAKRPRWICAWCTWTLIWSHLLVEEGFAVETLWPWSNTSISIPHAKRCLCVHTQGNVERSDRESSTWLRAYWQLWFCWRFADPAITSWGW